MGNKSRSKHYNHKSGYGAQGTFAQVQFPHMMPRLSRTDVDLLLPVLKEVGKVICPPAAIPIEILYQLYTHSDVITEVGSAINRGDYKGAVIAAGYQIVKDVVGTTLSSSANQSVEKVASSAGEITGNAFKDEQSKELAKKVTEASVKGGVEGIQDKIIDKTIDSIKGSIEGERSE